MTSGAVMIYVDWLVLEAKGEAEVEQAFFLRSTRLRASVLLITVSATKSLYEISSTAVNVDSASMKSSPPRVNCRFETR